MKSTKKLVITMKGGDAEKGIPSNVNGKNGNPLKKAFLIISR